MSSYLNKNPKILNCSWIFIPLKFLSPDFMVEYHVNDRKCILGSTLNMTYLDFSNNFLKVLLYILLD